MHRGNANLFAGQPKEFFSLLQTMAAEADAAQPRELSATFYTLHERALLFGNSSARLLFCAAALSSYSQGTVQAVEYRRKRFSFTPSEITVKKGETVRVSGLRPKPHLK
jgi:plastocyanin